MKIADINFHMNNNFYIDSEGRLWRTEDGELVNSEEMGELVKVNLSVICSLQEITILDFEECPNYDAIEPNAPVWGWMLDKPHICYPLHFSHYHNDEIYCYIKGYSGHTTHCVSKWDRITTTEPKEKMIIYSN